MSAQNICCYRKLKLSWILENNRFELERRVIVCFGLLTL